jgi:hypothetical protein
MTRYQWIIYISEARICELDVSFQFISDWITGWHFAETMGPSEFNIEVGRGFEPGEAGLYVYLECLDLLVAGRVAKSVVKILNRIAAGARGSRDFRYEDLVTDRFVF